MEDMDMKKGDRKWLMEYIESRLKEGIERAEHGIEMHANHYIDTTKEDLQKLIDMAQIPLEVKRDAVELMKKGGVAYDLVWTSEKNDAHSKWRLDAGWNTHDVIRGHTQTDMKLEKWRKYRITFVVEPLDEWDEEAMEREEEKDQVTSSLESTLKSLKDARASSLADLEKFRDHLTKIKDGELREGQTPVEDS